MYLRLALLLLLALSFGCLSGDSQEPGDGDVGPSGPVADAASDAGTDTDAGGAEAESGRFDFCRPVEVGESAVVGGAGVDSALPEILARFQVDGEPAGNLTLEVADTPESRTCGLMFRESLADDRGMLFVWGSEDERSFWMKNTRIPLDIVFLDSELRVINVEEAEPDPGDVADDDLRRYRSEAPARYVVEVNRGYSEEVGLSPGDTLELLGPADAG